MVAAGALGLFLLLVFATIRIERDQQKQRLDALQIQELNQTLENRVLDRTRALEEANRELADDLMNLSRIAGDGIEPSVVDLSEMASTVARELALQNPGRDVDVSVAPEISVRGDARLLRVALENLFGNAWKYIRGHRHQAGAV
jgi:signal transduction histidine kinase